MAARARRFFSDAHASHRRHRCSTKYDIQRRRRETLQTRYREASGAVILREYWLRQPRQGASARTATIIYNIYNKRVGTS